MYLRLVPLPNLHMPAMTNVRIYIKHIQVNDMIYSQPPNSHSTALCFQSLLWNEAQNQILLRNINEKFSSLPNQKSCSFSNLGFFLIFKPHILAASNYYTTQNSNDFYWSIVKILLSTSSSYSIIDFLYFSDF